MYPKISIITVVLNDVERILSTLQSIAEQKYRNFEHIIVDGESCDGTTEVIKSYKGHPLIIISEKDNGIYDAMNKGIQRASGDFIAFLNSGDQYINGIFEYFLQELMKSTADVLYGNVSICLSGQKIPLIYKSSKHITNNSFWRMPIAHPAMFASAKVISEVGLFNDTYKIAGDFEWTLRLHLSGARFLYANQIFVKMGAGGISAHSWKKGLLEMKLALIKNNNFTLYIKIFMAYSKAKTVLCLILSKFILYQHFRQLKNILTCNVIKNDSADLK